MAPRNPVDHFGPTTENRQIDNKHESGLLRRVPIVAGMASSAPATWWVLGRLDRSNDWIIDPDYVIPPPQVPRALAHAIGGLALVLALWGLVSLLKLARSNRGPWRTIGMWGPGFVAAAYLGLASHILTAPGIGANIGAGLVVFAALPVGLLLLVISLVAALAGRRRDTTTGPGSNQSRGFVA